MYCLFSLLRLRSIDPENPFSEALWLSSRPKRAIGLARERTHAVNTLLHAWVTPASVRALGATKSTHSARVKSQPQNRRAHLTMGNAPPEGLSPKDDAEAAQWAEEDAQAMRMPRYVPVASLGHANGCGFALAMLP